MPKLFYFLVFSAPYYNILIVFIRLYVQEIYQMKKQKSPFVQIILYFLFKFVYHSLNTPHFMTSTYLPFSYSLLIHSLSTPTLHHSHPSPTIASIIDATDAIVVHRSLVFENLFFFSYLNFDDSSSSSCSDF